MSFSISGQIGNTYQNKIFLTSNSDQEIKLHFNTKSDRIKILKNNYLLKSNTSKEFTFVNTVREGSYTDIIELKFITPDTNKTKIIINSFGYHLSSNDFHHKSNHLKTVYFTDDTLVFYRKYKSCEMKIYDYDKKNDFNAIENGKKKPLKTIPLSLERNYININELKKGIYLIRIIDYKNGINLYAGIEKE